jgi:hypothetical protein
MNTIPDGYSEFIKDLARSLHDVQGYFITTSQYDMDRLGLKLKELIQFEIKQHNLINKGN